MAGRTGEPMLTTYTSYDVFPRNDVPFEGSVNVSPHIGGQIPQKPKFWFVKAFSSQTREIGLFKLSYYQNYCMDSNQILHTGKDHQICFVSAPETRKTNPRWRTAPS